jgi:hypothetical protein
MFGTTLTEQLIERVKSMDINSICVKGSSNPRRPLEDELSLLEARFSKYGDNPHMAAIKKILKQHIQSLYEQ